MHLCSYGFLGSWMLFVQNLLSYVHHYFQVHGCFSFPDSIRMSLFFMFICFSINKFLRSHKFIWKRCLLLLSAITCQSCRCDGLQLPNSPWTVPGHTFPWHWHTDSVQILLMPFYFTASFRWAVFSNLQFLVPKITFKKAHSCLFW